MPDEQPNDNSWSLVVPFLDNSDAYAAGVEFGLIYARLRRRPKFFRDYIQRCNQEQVLLLANRLGYEVREMGSHDDYWLFLRLRRR